MYLVPVMVLLLAVASAGWCGICGDCNGDGDVDVADAVLVLRAAAGLSSLDAEQSARCDADGDGKLETAEALDVLRLAVGLGSASWILPHVELVAENSGAKQTEVLGEPGDLRAWALRVGNSAWFCRPFDTPVAFEGAEVEGWAGPRDAELVLVVGKLLRDQWGWHRITSAAVEKVGCIPSWARLVQWSRLLQAVTSLDLGKVSHPTYAEATTTMCRSGGWTQEVAAVLRDSQPRMLGASPDGRYVAFTVRGPRLPPLKSIVFRYMRVTVVYDLVQRTPARVVVDVEGWVEE